MKLNLPCLILLALLSWLLPGCEQEKQTERVDNIRLASFYIEQGNEQKALEILALELQTNPNQADVHRMMGVIFNNAEFYNDALGHYRRALELGCAQVCVEGLIDAYLGLGEYELAQKEYSEGITDKQSEASKYRAIMIVFHKFKNHDKTIKLLDGFTLPAATTTVMALKFEQGRYSEIVADFEADREYPSEQLLIFAKAFQMLGRYSDSEKILLSLQQKQKNRLLSPGKIEAMELLVKASDAQQKTEQAQRIYNAFLRDNEGTSYVAIRNTLDQLRQENFDAAIEELDELAGNKPPNAQLAQLRALALFGKRDYAGVISELEPFRSSLNEKSRLLLANAYNKNGRPNDTISLLQGAELNKIARIALSHAYLQRNDDNKALATLEPVSIELENHHFNIKLAEIWFQLRQYEKIISSFSNGFDHPLEIKYMVTGSFLRLKKVQEARQYVKKEPDSEISLELSGFVEASIGKHNAAIEVYKELVLYNRSNKVYLLLASSYFRNKDYPAALNTIREAVGFGRDNRALLNLTSKLLLESNHSETYQWLNSLAEDHRDYRAAQLILANYEIGRNQRAKAIERLNPLMKNAEAQTYFLMARAKHNSDPIESVRLMEQSLSSGFSLEAASPLHRYYIKIGDAENLERINDQVKQHGGSSIKSRRLLTQGYLALRQYDKANELAEDLIEQGNIYRGHELKGDVLIRQGKFSEAASIYQKILANQVEEPLLLKYFTSRIRANPKDTRNVLSEAEAILAKNPDMHALRNSIATMYVEIDNQAAARHFQFLVDRFPDDIVFLNNLAWTNLELNPAAALKYSEKAYQAYDNHPDILDTYVRALAKTNQVAKARQILEAKLRDQPGNQKLQSLLQGLN
ncbi:MAG: tetratricopeptide repeat protein [Gammaproteobacteria bacterium]|nr:tetratricopeptide repeat protein [Gammaproteobacteria bacterium]